MDSSINEELRSLKPPKLNTLTKEELRIYFDNTWQLYEMLFSSIKSDETFYLNPDPLRNPLIFYLGHTAAFYINKFRMAGFIQKGIHEHYDRLFAVGVDPDLPQNLEVSAYWPTVAEVRTYRQEVYKIVHEVIDEVNLDNLPIKENDPVWTLMMTLEHDRIHFETSSMLIRQLDINLVQRPECWKYAPTLGNPSSNEWIEMQGGSVNIGKPYDSDIYGWDNEFGTLSTFVKPFKATKNLITNKEFLEFVAANGYQNKTLWTTEGWDWKNRVGASKPKFWVTTSAGYEYRAMFDNLKLPIDWPVEVNAHEAWAYCAWKNDGSRLLSEAEFLSIARENTTKADDPLYEIGHNLDFVYGSPTPIGYMKDSVTASGFNDIYGNVWDWLKDDFYPLDGFKVHPHYADFSKPYMDTEHSMMAGGAWATIGTQASKYYRLWFRRHFFQHAGFRLAKDI